VNRRRFLKTLGFGTLGVMGLGSFVSARDAHSFQISRHELGMRGLKSPLRMVQLTDLHFGRFVFADWVRRWVDAANREGADVIVITGDLVDRPIPGDALDILAAELGRLEAKLGVFAVLGNHDYWYRTQDISVHGLIKRLERVGIRVFVNDSVMVRDDVFLAGLDDLWNGSPDLPRTLRDIPAKAASVLLSHNPDILARVPNSVGLTLSGHTHGGQIRIPGVRTLFSVSHYGERFQRGWVTGFQGARGYVSRGLGVGGLPFRTFCPAELVVLDLQPA
jgi:uncharacterized protein